jgi:hypothetical protein
MSLAQRSFAKCRCDECSYAECRCDECSYDVCYYVIILSVVAPHEIKTLEALKVNLTN